ncbi:hypothetical protein EK21DRAFT_51940 [Setomelanomma holmii]|uniref:Calcium uniporter protein n=1 Tax=Setomelanomma holmii TaxID=210430 RepID=A0A9P4HMB1_9PLEO|nr:hypothetical protein EK21DRAFT_51940 [Setomelanomma holmii]
MKHRIAGLASLSRASTCSRSLDTVQCPRRLPGISLQAATPRSLQFRGFALCARLRQESPRTHQYDNSNARPAAELNDNITQEEKDHFAKKLQEDKGKQIRTPWHREGSDVPPVARQRSAGAMTKGKLLTTPSRMLKIILPLTTKDTNTDRKDIEPLALLVHPQQPISYLERLIQAELPLITDKHGKERVPNVHFRAEDSMQSDAQPSEKAETTVSNDSEAIGEQEGEEDFEKVDEIRVGGKTEKTGKLSGGAKNRKTPDEATALRKGVGEGGVESYSGLGQDAPSDKKAERKFVRWSSSTELGDFIRDAARGQEFAIEIEGAPEEIRVGVPSFNDRTYYLRMRLRKTSKKIAEMADIKKECDHLAHKAAQRVAGAGFMGVVGWWGVVYYLTFQTDLGWDVMEPVTKLYHSKNFDLRKWEVLIDDGNTLRKEIKAVANEYDVEWDELADENSQKVSDALRNERRKQKKGKDDDDKDDDEPKSEEKQSEP